MKLIIVAAIAAIIGYTVYSTGTAPIAQSIAQVSNVLTVGK